MFNLDMRCMLPGCECQTSTCQRASNDRMQLPGHNTSPIEIKTNLNVTVTPLQTHQSNDPHYEHTHLLALRLKVIFHEWGRRFYASMVVVMPDQIFFDEMATLMSNIVRREICMGSDQVKRVSK